MNTAHIAAIPNKWFDLIWTRITCCASHFLTGDSHAVLRSSMHYSRTDWNSLTGTKVIQLTKIWWHWLLVMNGRVDVENGNYHVFVCVWGMMESMQPQHVAPLILWLCHEDCNITGQLFECGGGWMARCKSASYLSLFYTVSQLKWCQNSNPFLYCIT